MRNSKNLYRKKLEKIFKKIDLLASRGRDSELEFFKYINELLDKGDYTTLVEALYIYYNIDVSKESDVKSHRLKTWHRVCEQTNSKFSKRLNTLLKRLAKEWSTELSSDGIKYLEVYQVGLGVFVKKEDNASVVSDILIGYIREVDDFLDESKYHIKNKHYAKLIGDRKTLVEIEYNKVTEEGIVINGLIELIDTPPDSTLSEDHKLIERYEIALNMLIDEYENPTDI